VKAGRLARALRESRTALLLAVGLSTLVAVFWKPGASAGEPVRLVLVTLDTVRWDSFAGIDGRESAMPHLRRWAREATVFERFYSATASTQPSHASMLTGLHPWQHGVTRNGQRFDERYETVAEQLRAAGFATAAVVASFPVGARFGFAQGFQHFDDRFVRGRILGTEWGDAALREEGVALPPPGATFYSLADTVTERALALLDEATARRQFFWFHYFDPHAPYGDTAGGESTTPPQIFDRIAKGEDAAALVAHARELYDRDVAFLDESLGRLLARLEEDAGTIETHVVLVADHGESFGEDLSLSHGRRLIPSQVHVPLLIRSWRLAAGVRSDVVGSVDVAATLLALAGRQVETRIGSALAGRDLTRPAGRPGRAFGMRQTFREPYPDQRLDGSVVTIDGLLFFAVDEGGELYRGDRNGIDGLGSAASSDEVRSLRRLFASFEEALGNADASDETGDAEVRKALEALGYVP